MNRRSFLSNVLKAGVSIMILPSAVTYGRRWVMQTNGMWTINPIWINAQYRFDFMELPFFVSKVELDPMFCIESFEKLYGELNWRRNVGNVIKTV